MTTVRPVTTETMPIDTKRTGGSGRSPSVFTLIGAVVAIVVTLLIVGPLVLTVPRLFFVDGQLDLSPFAAVWNLPGLWQMITNTIILVVVSTAIAVVLAATLAWLDERTTARMGWLSETLPIIPLLILPLAGTIGWILLAEPGPGLLNTILRSIGLGEAGAQGPLDIYSWPGLIFVQTLYLVPHAYLVIAAALRNVDPSLEEASRVSGAGEVRTLLRVTLPAVRPAIASGALLAMVIGFTLFAVQVLIGTEARIDLLSVAVVRLAVRVFPAQLAEAVVLGVVMVVFVGTLAILQARLSRAGHHATVTGKFGGASRVNLGPAGNVLARTFMLGYPVLTSLFPLVALILISLQPYWSATIDWSTLSFAAYERILSGNGRELLAIRNSVLLGVVGATVAIILAAVLDVYRHAQPRGWVRNAIYSITRLPSVVSHIIIALAILAALAGPPFMLSGTLTILLLGYIALWMPQASVSSDSAHAQVDPSLVEASRSTGASDGKTFLRIQLPLMLPGLTAGWVFLFVLMAGDLTGSVMLVSTQTPVIATVLLDAFEAATYPVVAALSVIASVVPSIIVVGVLVTARRMQQRRLHRKPSKSNGVAELGTPPVGV